MSEEKADYKAFLDPTTKRFIRGNPGGPGRKPFTDAQRLQNTVHKLLATIVDQATVRYTELATNPANLNELTAFLHAIAKFLPKQMQVETSSQTDELLALLASQPSNSPIAKLKDREQSVAD